jgi:hypothetical protein
MSKFRSFKFTAIEYRAVPADTQAIGIHTAGSTNSDTTFEIPVQAEL